MSIKEIVEEATMKGYLTPAMEAEVGNICEGVAELSTEEYAALDNLMGLLLRGDVLAVPHKQFINVMEELVVTEAMNQVAKVSNKSGKELDIGDVAAYALNRLPPLYATSEQGASYQRERADQELRSLIGVQVQEGIASFLERPNLPDRKPLEKSDKTILSQISGLLGSIAPD
ncbi:MAG: late competence development ComFB family protein [Microcystaceae cyanobacterium]